MLSNYLKIARRNLWNNRGYTIINTLGLATGVSVFTIVLLYCNYEKSYDKWDKQLQQVYRAGITEKTGGDVSRSPSVQYPLGSYLISECPEVSRITRVRPLGGEMLIAYANNSFFNKHIIAADSSFFSVFPYKFLYGDVKSALNGTNSMVINAEMSRRLFGNDNPVGKTVKLENKDTYTITGVIERSGPSHLDFEVCISNNSNYFAANWFMKNQDTYVLVKHNGRISLLQKKAQDIYLEYNKLIPKNTEAQVFFEPVADIHLSSEGQNLYNAAMMPVYDFGANNIPLNGLLLTGTVILLLSCINYANMAVAGAGKRAKESGLRKVLGAARRQIVMQFLTEALIQCFIAALTALLMVLLLRNIVNNTFNLHLAVWNGINNAQNYKLIAQLIAIIAGTALISGVYPAFVLAGLKPVNVLKGNLVKNVGGKYLRKGLIVFQYSVATSFIVSILIIGLQMHFLHAKDPGFKAGQTLRVSVRWHSPTLFPGQQGDQSEYIAASIMKIPGVKIVSMSDSYPGQAAANIQQAQMGDKADTMSMAFNYVNFNYFDLLGMQMASGRQFSRAFITDTINAAVINQTAANKYGKVNPLGKVIDIVGRKYTVIGVLKDTYLTGYQSKVLPEIYAIGVKAGNFSGHNNLLIKVDGSNAKNVLHDLEAFWKTVDPGYPMRYSWMDKDFEKLMEKDERFNQAAVLLTLIAVVLAGIGIFALSAFTAGQRTKEIGIRKVLGASAVGVLWSFCTDFLKLVLLSATIAFPISGILMHNWLQDFAYHIEVKWWMFVIAGAAAVLVALATISYQALKAAMTNPVNNLRAE